ncbi:MAG: tetrahydrofolate dehydrogenase/cyclohydrolase catalytic domain-containing protein [Planctomycetota bacterium]
MKLLEGKPIADDIHRLTAGRVQELKKTRNIQPGLAVVLIGEDPASQVYVNTKVKKCLELGIHSEKHVFPATAKQDEVIALLKSLNANPKIHGILVQSPPPAGIDEKALVETILPAKDVDCFHPENVGRMTIGEGDSLLPCTPLGVMVLLAKSGISLKGKHAVVLGRSNIVGKPMMLLLARKAANANATVTVCHSATADIKAITRQADVLIAAIGKANVVKAGMVKEGAVVVDVGINRVDDPSAPKGYRLVGDVDFKEVAPKCSWITPVPGGVGPMTIALLMHNAVRACALQNRVPLADPLYDN